MLAVGGCSAVDTVESPRYRGVGGVLNDSDYAVHTVPEGACRHSVAQRFHGTHGLLQPTAVRSLTLPFLRERTAVGCSTMASVKMPSDTFRHGLGRSDTVWDPKPCV